MTVAVRAQKSSLRSGVPRMALGMARTTAAALRGAWQRGTEALRPLRTSFEWRGREAPCQVVAPQV